MLNHSKTEPMGILYDVLCQVGVTTIIAKFLILYMPIDKDTPILVGRGFLHTCGGILNTIDNITSTFDGICYQTFCAAKTSLDTAESDSDDEEEYAIQRNKFGAPIYGPKPARLWEHTMMKPDHQEPNALDNTKPWRKYCSHRFIMNFWNGKVATEMRSQELCHEFYSTYEFDEVCADDELKTKKIIKFRLGGRAHRGLRSDEHFNAQEYWLSISREENLSLSRSHASTIRILVLRVLHKMITYGLCQRTTGDLDTTMLRELIDSEGRLILRFHSRMYPRFANPETTKSIEQDLYARMDSMEILQE
ncbi:hypothetical protein Tco_0814125 [Tanacetum coccineum]